MRATIRPLIIIAIITLFLVSGAFSQFVTTQYYTLWGACDMHPSKLQRTDYVIWFNTSANTTAPYYFNLYAGSNDSLQWARSAQNGSCAYAVQDSLRAWAKANGTKLIISGLFGSGSAFATNIQDTSAGGAGEKMMNTWLGFVQRNGYNGIDIDWEYPSNSAAQRQDVVVWLRKARAIMNTWTPKGTIILTIPQWSEWSPGNPNGGFIYDSQAWQYVDYVQIMAYNEESCSKVSHNQPIYSYPQDPGAWYWDYRGWHELIQSGCPMNKIIMLASAECKAWTGSGLTLGSSGSEVGGCGSFHSANQFAVSLYSNPIWDPVAQATYYTNGSTAVSAESYRSMQAKAAYVKAQVSNGQHLAGMGVYDPWRLFDTRQAVPDSAMRGFVQGMGGDTVIIPPPPPPTYKLKGQLFFDVNGNGTQDPNEPGLGGWAIQLTGTASASGTTDSLGQFEFDSLAAGTYQVSQVLRSQWRQTFPANGGGYTVTFPGSAGIANFGDYTTNAIPISINKNWNILSLPATVTDSRLAAVYPAAQSEAFAFEGVYIPSADLYPGLGYWIRFGQTMTDYVIGQPLATDTVNLTVADWNIIGSVGHPIDVNAIQTIPDGILDSKFYGYDNGLYLSDTIQPGLGYWIKLNAAGSIVFPAASLQQSATPKESAAFAGMNSITLITNQGYRQTLYFGENTNSPVLESTYKLPPMFPGAFSAQFTGYGGPATMVRVVPQKNPGTMNMPISLQAIDYPLTIRIHLPQAGKHSYFLSDNAASYPLVDDGEIVLHGDTAGTAGAGTLTVTASASSAMPASFSLGQNYPNPFNPATQIAFEVPQTSRIRVEVYNLLGEKVATLADRDMSAGFYTVPFDGSRLASGVYYYRLSAAAGSLQLFQQIRKMVLLK